MRLNEQAIVVYLQGFSFSQSLINAVIEQLDWEA